MNLLHAIHSCHLFSPSLDNKRGLSTKTTEAIAQHTISQKKTFFRQRSFHIMTQAGNIIPATFETTDSPSGSFLKVAPQNPTLFIKSRNSAKPNTADEKKNPTTVEVGSLSHYSQGFIYARWLFGIFEPSTVGPRLPFFIVHRPTKKASTSLAFLGKFKVHPTISSKPLEKGG